MGLAWHETCDKPWRMKGQLADPERIQGRILFLRGRRVLLDHDLAPVYGVPVKALNQAVKRNPRRFPEDFVFRLSAEEALSMRSRIVTASTRNVRYRPLAFTEHGAIMAANVLRSRRAEESSVLVVRAFVRLRQALSTNRRLAEKLIELERRVDTHDGAITEVMAAIRELMEDAEDSTPKARIGFRRE